MNLDKLACTAPRQRPQSEVIEGGSEFDKVDGFLGLLESHELCILAPAGGFGPTWASHGESGARRTLDYFFSSSSAAQNARELEIGPQAIAATSHFPLCLKWGPRAGSAEKKTGNHKREGFQRRKWPGWREAATRLARPARWASLAAAEVDIARAGRTGGAVARTSKQTPFDSLLHYLVAARKTEEGARRKIAQRSILAVRKQQSSGGQSSA